MKNASGFGMGYFNPRSREGSDFFKLILRCLYVHFNPRSREGSDFKGYRKIVKIHRFQSSLPRGERRLTQSMLGTCRYFNPRSREGSDKRRPQKIWRITHFNPRSREGSDINLAWLLLISQNFNPRSREAPILRSHPARGAWIEMIMRVITPVMLCVAPRKGCVD